MAKYSSDWKEGYRDGLAEACRIIAQMLADNPQPMVSDFMQGWEEGRKATLENLHEALGWKELKHMEPAQ